MLLFHDLWIKATIWHKDFGCAILANCSQLSSPDWLLRWNGKLSDGIRLAIKRVDIIRTWHHDHSQFDYCQLFPIENRRHRCDPEIWDERTGDQDNQIRQVGSFYLPASLHRAVRPAVCDWVFISLSDIARVGLFCKEKDCRSEPGIRHPKAFADQHALLRQSKVCLAAQTDSHHGPE